MHHRSWSNRTGSRLLTACKRRGRTKSHQATLTMLVQEDLRHRLNVEFEWKGRC